MSEEAKRPGETQYDKIAQAYKDHKAHPWHQFVEEFTFFSEVGDLKGKSVLDLACGEGNLTRKFAAGLFVMLARSLLSALCELPFV